MSRQKARRGSTEAEAETKDFHIVGIGASAGGVQALQIFFEKVNKNREAAYVVILHLLPDHDSELAQILQRVCTLNVVQVTERVKVEPDYVYVVSPNQHLMMEDEWIAVSPNILPEERRAPVDIFFRTLAETQSERAICVVLSGTGANGSMGLKRVKECGGAAFVQNPREAAFNEMPRNAIATGLVDEVLNVADIPGKIQSYRAGLATVHISEKSSDKHQQEQMALREIFTHLKTSTGHDFTSYKRPTMLRRVERRISIRSQPDLLAYAAYVRKHPEELSFLLKDLLISVTNFFRDPKAYNHLERDVIPRLLQDKTSEAEVRIWVAGCATGEEAYSIAILCAEQMGHLPDVPKVQIFATDIDESAIAKARDGIYTLNDAADVSRERLRRFFSKENEGYRINREIREMVLFAHHDFIKDPPFSRLDLVTCRNVLIYLTPAAQERVLEIFHFALRPKGFLFLGTAESADVASDLYSTLSREQHIYQSRPVKPRGYPVPESVPPQGGIQISRSSSGNNEQKHSWETRLSFGELHQHMLELYAPPSLIVNEEFEVVHVTERAARYLQMSSGEPSRNLFSLILQELRPELRSALYQAMNQGVSVEAKDLKVRVDNQVETLNIHVRPAFGSGETAHGFILILFEKVETSPDTEERAIAADQPVAQQLEAELNRMKNQLRTSGFQHEFQAEELKATNEELQAMNEELRSAAEELETSKEELQSINEELSTVNQELKVKIEEKSIASNNLQNLINSTNIGTIFLDRSLRVALFTPPARNIFNLIPSDRGRPLSDITNKLEYTELLEDAAKVLENLSPIEREVHTSDDQVYLMRVLPYRTEDDRINGVVVTFIDITERRRSEALLSTSEEQMRAIIQQTTAAIARTKLDGEFTFVNQTYCRMLGYSIEELTGRRLQEFTHPDDVERSQELFRKLAHTGEAYNIEKRYVRKDGTIVWVLKSVSAIHDSDGNIEQILAVSVDITNRKTAEAELRENEEKYRAVISSIDEGFKLDEVIYGKDNRPGSIRTLEVNPTYTRLIEIMQLSQKDDDHTPPDPNEIWQDLEFEVAQSGSPTRIERYVEATRGWYSVFAAPVGGSEGTRVALIINDITERKEQDLRREFLLSLSDSLRPESEAADIKNAACSLLGKYLGVNRVNYFDINGNDFNTDLGYFKDVEPLSERTIRNLGTCWTRILGAAEMIVSNDVQSDPRFSSEERSYLHSSGIEAFIVAMVVRDGHRLAAFAIQNLKPGTWTADEIELVRDVSERIHESAQRAITEAALLDKQLRLEIAQRAARVGIWGYDLVTHQGIATPEWNELTGYPYPGSSFDLDLFLELVHPDDRPALRKAYDDAISEHKAIELEFRILHRSEGLLWLLKRGQYIPPHEKTNPALMGSVIDITERRKLEQQKDQFIGIASHELRTPITSIKAYTQVLEETFSSAGDSASARLMQKMDQQVDRLTSSVSSLLDTTRISEGRLQLQKSTFEINELLSDTIEIMQRLTSAQHFSLQLGQPVLVYADRERIQQVVTNLINNAIKYGPDADRIILQTSVSDGMLKVCVQDFGIGIDQENQQTVFERFFRVEQLINSSGLGLGLYISSAIVREHGGTFTVESKKGDGSTFCFTLPIAQSS